MRFLGIQDLRADLPNVVRDVEKRGAEVVVTRHGKPVAALLELATVDAFLRQTKKHREKLHPELQGLAEDLALQIAGRDAETAWTLLYNAADLAIERLEQCNPPEARDTAERAILKMIHEARRRSFRIESYAKSARS
jgi:prevent-host-death family protein